MRITYLGHASFLLKGLKTRIVTDPYDSAMLDMKYPSTEADIVTVSHQHHDHNHTASVKGDFAVFDFPGEYEKSGVRIFGYQTYHDNKEGKERGENIMFKILVEDMVVLHCGDLGHLLNEGLIEEIKDTNILLVPVGGIYTIGPQEAVKLVKMINPEVVIPMHFNHPKLNQETFGSLANVNEFLKLMGKESIEPVTQLDVSTDTLPENEVILFSI